ncbi:MAG: hypothetical protein WCT77_00225 [Bacteroidota bacterium]
MKKGLIWTLGILGVVGLGIAGYFVFKPKDETTDSGGTGTGGGDTPINKDNIANTGTMDLNPNLGLIKNIKDTAKNKGFTVTEARSGSLLVTIKSGTTKLAEFKPSDSKAVLDAVLAIVLNTMKYTGLGSGALNTGSSDAIYKAGIIEQIKSEVSKKNFTATISDNGVTVLSGNTIVSDFLKSSDKAKYDSELAKIKNTPVYVNPDIRTLTQAQADLLARQISNNATDIIGKTNLIANKRGSITGFTNIINQSVSSLGLTPYIFNANTVKVVPKMTQAQADALALTINTIMHLQKPSPAEIALVMTNQDALNKAGYDVKEVAKTFIAVMKPFPPSITATETAIINAMNDKKTTENQISVLETEKATLTTDSSNKIKTLTDNHYVYNPQTGKATYTSWVV